MAKLRAFVDVLVPARRSKTVVDLLHRDASGNGTNDFAQVAAHAFVLVDDRNALIAFLRREDALVRTVLTGHDAVITADALIVVDLRDNLVVHVEVAPLREARERLPNHLVDGRIVVILHIGREAFDHILNDAVAAEHDLGADLHAGGSEQQELDRVTPVRDAADAADWNVEVRVTTEAGCHMKRDRLDGRAAITPVAREVADAWNDDLSVDIHADDALDRIDQRDAMRPTPLGRQTVRDDIPDVRRELHEHRHRRILDRPGRNLLIDRGLLTDRGAHATLTHPVRTAKVELKTIRARVDAALDDVFPLLLGLHHEGNDDGVLRVLLFDLGDLAEVALEGPVRDELDIVEADRVGATIAETTEAARDVLNRLAERLPNRATPAVVKRAHDLVAGVGRGRRGEPERIGRFDPRTVGVQADRFLL